MEYAEEIRSAEPRPAGPGEGTGFLRAWRDGEEGPEFEW